MGQSSGGAAHLQLGQYGHGRVWHPHARIDEADPLVRPDRPAVAHHHLEQQLGPASGAISSGPSLRADDTADETG